MDVLGANHLHQNFPPVLLREVLGNIAKDFGEGPTALNMVRSLAHKIGGMHSTINVDYRQICIPELAGLARVPMNECGIMAVGTSLHRTPDGETAMLVDQSE